MGRRREPSAVKEAKGNPGRRPVAKGAPTDGGGIVQPVASTSGLPDWIDTRASLPRGRKGWGNAARLSALAERIWNFAHPELVRLNLVKSLDEVALGIYCRAVAEYVDCTVMLDRDGMHYDAQSYGNSENGQILKRLHPAFHVREKALKTVEKYGEVLGMNPSARQRMFQQLLGAGVQGRLPGMDDAPRLDDELPLAGSSASTSPIGLLN